MSGPTQVQLEEFARKLRALTRERPRAAMIEPMERLPPEWKAA